MNGVLPELPGGSPQALTPEPNGYCDLCGEAVDASCECEAASEASGLAICSICLEDMIYAHQ